MNQGSSGTTASATPDIVFKCGNCGMSLVVDAAAAGMTLNCQCCGQPTAVPKASTPPTPTQSAEATNQQADLQRQLKENDSQRTEITSYINQLSIQLHRWQLRLQTLNDRRKELLTQLNGAA